jgi:hypothetical protein
MLRSSILVALIGFISPRPNCVDIRVGSDASPSDLTKGSCKVVINHRFVTKQHVEPEHATNIAFVAAPAETTCTAQNDRTAAEIYGPR